MRLEQLTAEGAEPLKKLNLLKDLNFAAKRNQRSQSIHWIRDISEIKVLSVSAVPVVGYASFGLDFSESCLSG